MPVWVLKIEFSVAPQTIKPLRATSPYPEYRASHSPMNQNSNNIIWGFLIRKQGGLNSTNAPSQALSVYSSRFDFQVDRESKAAQKAVEGQRDFSEGSA